jgi:hypothetical protein
MSPAVPTSLPIQDLNVARHYVQGFPCPAGFSSFAWRQLQQTAMSVWNAHLTGSIYRGSLHFCRPEFYSMLQQPNGEPIVPAGQIRGYRAA